ncbi:MAG: hypothetical protein Q7O66_19760 [Dehalococcoidia bacterium]|nr:hypothetical protein [Dehalococcoidia bacterium]
MSICKPSLLILLRAEHEAAVALEVSVKALMGDELIGAAGAKIIFKHQALYKTWQATVKAVEEALK